jgi:hypothetical protein
MVGALFSNDNGIDAVDVHFTPPGFLTRSQPRQMVKLGSVKHWAVFANRVAENSDVVTPSQEPLKAKPLRIVSLADGRTLRSVSAEQLRFLSERLGAPVSFEQICLPPTPILLSDAVFLEYFLSRARDSRAFEKVLSVRDKLRDADVVVIDDISELQWPMIRSYPVLSHRLERSADADLLAYRGEVYTGLHDRLPITVVNGSSLALDGRDTVIDAFSRVLRTSVFRVATATALAAFTTEWDFRPMSTGVGGPGQAPVKPGVFVRALYDWIARRIEDGTIRAPSGTPGVEMIGQIDFRPFDCQAADRESLTRVLDAFNHFCITGPASSVTFIRKYLAAAGKPFVRAAGHGPADLETAEPFDCLLCCGSTGPIKTSRPAVAVMGAGWPSPTVNLSEPLSNVPPRGRVPTSPPANWYSPLPPRDGLTGPEQEALLEIARLTREQRERVLARGDAGAPTGATPRRQGSFEAVGTD